MFAYINGYSTFDCRSMIFKLHDLFDKNAIKFKNNISVKNNKYMARIRGTKEDEGPPQYFIHTKTVSYFHHLRFFRF